MDQQKEKQACLLVLSTFPNVEAARQIGTILVQRQLAACVNLVPEVTSIYRWKDKVETGGEILALIKTTAENLDPLKAAITDLHPYDEPEVVALEIAGGSASYLNWLVESCRPVS